MKRLWIIVLSFVWMMPLNALALSDVERSVWVNEAIVATYTFNHQNFLERQKEIAKYFTAKGWIAFSAALNQAKLPQIVKENAYYVSAVALMPVELKKITATQWQAQMPLLVVFKNPQYQQKQTLNVSVRFTSVTGGLGVRGLAITDLHSTVIEPPCQCLKKNKPIDKVEKIGLM